MSKLRNEIRTRMKAWRASLTNDQLRQKAIRLTEMLAERESYKQAKHIGFYYPLPGELDTRDILALSRKKEKVAYLPVIVSGYRVLQFLAYGCETDLVQGHYNILEPHKSSQAIPVSDLDLLLVPCLAIDKRGYRLGFGKGWYDKTIGLSRGEKMPVILFMAYQENLVQSCYPHKHDIQADEVLLV